jgi:hypothetical protein
MFLFDCDARKMRLSAFAALGTACLVSGCNLLHPPRVMPVYTWDFYKIRPDATPKDKAFNECEALARKRNRFVGNGYMQGYNVAGDVLTCMKWEGWGQSTRAVTFEPIRRAEP